MEIAKFIGKLKFIILQENNAKASINISSRKEIKNKNE